MIRTALLLVGDCCSSWRGLFFPRRLAAENLFLRKQLAFYVERNVRPRRLDDAARIALIVSRG